MEFIFDREESTKKSKCKAIIGRKSAKSKRIKPVLELETNMQGKNLFQKMINSIIKMNGYRKK